MDTKMTHAARAELTNVVRQRYRGPGRAPVPYSCIAHLSEMHQWLEDHPDQNAQELLVEFQGRYPGIYRRSHLRTLRRRVQAWRREAIRRLIFELQVHAQDVSAELLTSDAFGVRLRLAQDR